jgi:hypothetical protein
MTEVGYVFSNGGVGVAIALANNVMKLLTGCLKVGATAGPTFGSALGCGVAEFLPPI